jgi:hypothetical protein
MQLIPGPSGWLFTYKKTKDCFRLEDGEIRIFHQINPNSTNNNSENIHTLNNSNLAMIHYIKRMHINMQIQQILYRRTLLDDDISQLQFVLWHT